MSIIFHLQTILLGFLVAAAGLLYVPAFISDPYEYPKAIVLIGITALLTIVNLVHGFLSNTTFSWKKIPLEVKLFFLVVVAETLAFIFSSNHFYSLFGAPYRFLGYISQLVLAFYFFNVVYVFSHLPDHFRRRFFIFITGIAFVSAIFSISPFFFSDSYFSLQHFNNRIFGALGNPNYFALYLAALLPFFCFYFRSNVRTVRLGSAVIFLLLIVVLFLTGSRSAWVALIFGFFSIGIIAAFKEKKYRILLAVFVAIFSLVALFLFQRFFETQPLQRLSMTEKNVGSVTTRFYLQKAGWNLFLERPLFGTGQEMVMGHIEPYLPEYLKMNDVFYIDRTHNEFLDVLVMQGLVGFFAFVTFWFVLMWRAIRHYSSLAPPEFLYCLCAAFVILSYFAMNFAIVSANILLYLFAGYLVSVCTNMKKVAIP